MEHCHEHAHALQGCRRPGVGQVWHGAFLATTGNGHCQCAAHIVFAVVHHFASWRLARRCGGEARGFLRGGRTEPDLDLLDEASWWNLDDLVAVTEEVFPLGLPHLVRELLAGWDGVARHLDEDRH